jgi:hypothetical protein
MRKLQRIAFVVAILVPGFSFAQNYFQQQLKYDIQVSLDDKQHLLRGYETIEYTNHSSDTLHEIWFHLWPNGYKNRKTEFAKQELRNNKTKFHFAKEHERGAIDSLDFRVNNENATLEYASNNPDMAKLHLKTALLPGQTVQISTPFRVKIPSSDFSRLGHSKQQYQLCQWYPKPAVYDRKGWHPMPYLNQGEFYSEFASFKVSITLPENYVLAASGNMDANPEEEQRILDNIRQTDEYLQKGFPAKDTFPPSSAKLKTVTYRLDSVHDFAWFADKRYHIMVGEAQLDGSGKTIDTYAYFCNKNAKEWSKAVEYTADALKHYSKLVGDYPYAVCKVVDGALSAGAGMEYPSITIIAYPGTAEALDRVIAHEVGHNWFYGILASNERNHPWMDEGMNSYYEKRYMAGKYPETGVFGQLNIKPLRNLIHLDELDKNAFNQMAYLFLARRNDDQAAGCHANDFQTANYAGMVYEKTAGLMAYLAAWMGQDKFDAMMKDYFQQWKFKHPYPEDFRKLAETQTGQDLSWWFNDLIDTRKRLDYAFTGISKKQPGKVILKLRNKGNVSAPFSVSSISKNGEISNTRWYEGFNGRKKLELTETPAYKYGIDATYAMPEFDVRNNEIRSQGLCKRTGKLKLQFLSGFETPNSQKFYYLPAIGYNMYNGFMAGAILHNIGITRKNFEFIAMPFYGFGNKELAGNVNIDYFIRPLNGFVKSITFNASASRYALAYANHFDRFVTGAALVLKNRKPTSRVKKELLVRHIQVEYTPYLSASTIADQPVKRSVGYNQLLFSFTDKRKLNPYGAILDVQQGDGFAKASATIYHFFAYNSVKRGLYIRLFAGTFLWKAADFANNPDVRFRLSGQTGSQDYLYQQIFIGRNELNGLWARQMTETDGAFKVYSGRGQTLDRLVAINLKSGIPGNLPIRLFADIGFYMNGESDRDAMNYCAGAVVSIIPEAFEVYFPFLISDKIRKTMDINPTTNSYGERIRFVLNIQLANPVNILRTLDL